MPLHAVIGVITPIDL